MRIGIFLIGLLGIMTGGHAVEVTDDLGRTVRLASPARRIVSLSPHLTELLFSAGAGRQIVATVSYSNYPPAARKIPRIGGYTLLDVERIIALRPDLVVAWHSGNPRGQLERLEQLGIPVYYSEPRSLEAIAATIRHFGILTGHERLARKRSRQFLQGIGRLRQRYGKQRPVRVFYQIWHRPLMTINGRHFISKVIRLCGGRNVFAAEPALVPRIGIESVIARAPEVIIASGMAEKRPHWVKDWLAWPAIPAVRRRHLYVIHPDLIQRPTARLLQGARQMCEALQHARLSVSQRE